MFLNISICTGSDDDDDHDGFLPSSSPSSSVPSLFQLLALIQLPST